MKFLSIALAALVGFSEAKKSITGKQLKDRMSKGQFNKESLMRGAKPYGKTARMLEQNQWEINGLYSVQFDSCLSLTVQDEDLFGEDFIEMAQDGVLVAEKSYILFNVCYTEDCYYQGDDDKLTFITDIASFFGAFYDFLPNQVENYCEGCRQNQDYCYGNLDEYAQADNNADEAEEQGEGEEGEQGEDQAEGEEGEGEGEQGEGEGEGGERRKHTKMATTGRRLQNDRVVEYIDCDLCYEYECFDDDQQADAYEEYVFDDALAWLEGLAQCDQIEDQQWNNNAIYAGLICNAEGNGVEIGVFLDQECSLYTNQLSYSTVMSYADTEYFSMSSDLVEYMFTNDFSCYQVEVEYTNPYEEQQQEEEEQADEYNYEVPEAAEWCQNLFNGGNMQATSLYDCGVDQDQEQNQEDEYDYNLSYYEWYSYQLSEQAANDPSETCEVVRALEGETPTVYDKDNSGYLYNYKKNSGFNSKDGGLSGGAIALIVIILVGAAAGAAFMFQSKSNKKDKKEPLINNGSMA